AEVNRRACEMLRKVFETYVVDPDRLGETAAKRIEAEGLHRTVCDYVAGMTDRYLMEEYADNRPVAASLSQAAAGCRPQRHAAALPLSSRKYWITSRSR